MQAPYTFDSYLYAIKKYRDEKRIQVANRNVKISSLIRERNGNFGAIYINIIILGWYTINRLIFTIL